jgi:hypothetical protein
MLVTEWPEYRELVWESIRKVPIVDGAHFLERERLEACFSVIGIGRSDLVLLSYFSSCSGLVLETGYFGTMSAAKSLSFALFSRPLRSFTLFRMTKKSYCGPAGTSTRQTWLTPIYMMDKFNRPRMIK